MVEALPDSVLPPAARKRSCEVEAEGACGRKRRAAPRSKAAACAAPLPPQLAPQLATLAAAVPAGAAGWVFENKFDGYRLLARIEGGDARGCAPATATTGPTGCRHWPRQLAAWRIDSAWLDGEIVAAGADGRHDFNALQNAFDRKRTQAIDYHLFDLPLLRWP